MGLHNKVHIIRETKIQEERSKTSKKWDRYLDRARHARLCLLCLTKNLFTSSKNEMICNVCGIQMHILTINAPITTKVDCFSRLLKCLRSLCGKQCGPRSDCSYRSILIWVHAVSNVRQLFAADSFSRRHFQMHFFFLTL